MKRRLFLLSGACAALAYSLFPALVPLGPALVPLGPAHAQGPAVDAGNFVDSFAQKAMASLTGAGVSAPERRERFRALFLEGFAVPQIGQFILGRFWRVASDAERAEYLQLFTDYIVQIYANRLTDYSDGTLRVLQSRAEPDNQATVNSEFARPSSAPAKIDWQVRKDSSANYRVLDLRIEGVSMSITQRDEFAAIIQRNGGKIEGLLAQLRAKTR